MAKQKFSDRVLARAAADKPKPPGFFSNLTPEIQAELLEIRRAYQSGATGLSQQAIARSIIADCQENGIPICGMQGLRNWLSRKV
jgi:hypothetical protein